MAKRDPKLRRQTGKKGAADRAFVELGGRRIYLGKWGSRGPGEEVLAEYHRVLLEWQSAGKRHPVERDELQVVELSARFLEHAETYYRKPDGTPTGELRNHRLAIRELTKDLGRTPVADFGPRALKAIRERMVSRAVSRRYVNHTTGRIKRIFRWGVAEELVDVSVYQALAAVPGLRRGRSKAKDHPRVLPVPEKHVEAVKAKASRQVRALIDLQLLTAARSGELVSMRPCNLDTSGRVWLYRLDEHKTAYRGHERTIYIGPRAQAVLRPFLKGRAPSAYVFSPKEAEEERRAAQHAARKTPLSSGNAPGTNRRGNPRWSPGDCYTRDTYARAIARACKAAKVPHWHPHRLRHNAATHLRKEFGLEAARIILGHASPAITDLYAELDREKAVEIVKAIG